MAATVTGVLLTGIHASRPSSGVSAGTLYSCTTHSLIYQTSDTGSTWTTWASLSGTASGTVSTVEEVDGSPTDSAVTKIVFPNGTLGITSHVATYTPSAVALTETENFLTGDVTITTADTFYDGPSLTLNGTYLLIGVATVTGRSGGQDAISAKLWNGTTVKATGETQDAGSLAAVSIPLSAWVVTSGSETWKISCATNNGGAAIKATLPHNGTTNKASYLIAIKIA